MSLLVAMRATGHRPGVVCPELGVGCERGCEPVWLIEWLIVCAVEEKQSRQMMMKKTIVTQEVEIRGYTIPRDSAGI